MPCVKFETKEAHGFYCFNYAYKYKGYLFEYHHYLGPFPLKKNGEPRKNIPKGFWDAVYEWKDLPEEEKQKCLWDGGEE